jgi:methylmalonyl-CoA mutase N-terminal domain/subunit
LGGTLEAIETGFIQNEIQNAAYDAQRAIEAGERIVVGLNRFQQEETGSAATFRLDPALERDQLERLRQFRAGRSAATVEGKLALLECAARGTDNLMPPILDAAAAHATLGEIADTLRRVFGEYREL